MLIAGRDVEGIGLGTAQFAFKDGTPADSVATVHAALGAGVRLIDTALAYTRPGVESYAEQVVARALRGITGARPLVATKGGHWRDGDGFPVDGRPTTLRAHCEISLRTLETRRCAARRAHRRRPRSRSPGDVACPCTASCWPGSGGSRRTLCPSSAPAGPRLFRIRPPRSPSTSATSRNCALLRSRPHRGERGFDLAR